jgi:hypothetical protein
MQQNEKNNQEFLISNGDRKSNFKLHNCIF